MLGVIQWNDLLSRPLFSILHCTYAFARRSRQNVVQQLPASVVKELLLVVALAPTWEADLIRPWLGELQATDASTSFGFGVSTCKCSPHFARKLGRLSEKRGDYVRLADVEEATKKDRIGKPFTYTCQ